MVVCSACGQEQAEEVSSYKFKAIILCLSCISIITGRFLDIGLKSAFKEVSDDEV